MNTIDTPRIISGAGISSVFDFGESINAYTAFAPFTGGGVNYSGPTPDQSHDWAYGGGFILKRGEGKHYIWYCTSAWAVGRDSGTSNITWTVYDYTHG